MKQAAALAVSPRSRSKRARKSFRLIRAWQSRLPRVATPALLVFPSFRWVS